MKCVFNAAQAVLLASTVEAKCAAAHSLSKAWQRGHLILSDEAYALSRPHLPDRPARPALPLMVPPYKVKRRRLGTPKGRGALLHAVAHIEFNAIDLAADMIARFSAHAMIARADRHAFISDWVSVCDDEARHFELIQSRLTDLDMAYGDLPAHDGLWQAAHATAHDFIARLVIAPMVLEARGLDVTPGMIAKLKSANDPESAAVMQIIFDDEIGHVAFGSKWFHITCKDQSLEPKLCFQDKVRRYFKGLLKPPFNRPARDLAGLPHSFYEPLAFEIK